MENANVNGITLEYEIKGSGEPVLLIGGAHIAAGYLPFLSQPALTGRYRLVRYHKRGLAGSTHTPPPVSIADHAADAAALLAELEIARAHVVGHSSGGAIALQLALDRPELVESLILLEPAMLSVPGAQKFFEKAAASVESYKAGDRAAAVAIFLAAVSGLEWSACRAVLDRNIPRGIDQAVRDADTFFSAELPALMAWTLTDDQTARIDQPALLVKGNRTEELFVEAVDFLRRRLPRSEVRTIDGVGHLLHMQQPQPVASAIGAFLANRKVLGHYCRAANHERLRTSARSAG